jgi:hypothetical protein
MNDSETYLGWWCMGDHQNLENCDSYPGELTIDSDSTITLKIMGEPKQLRDNLWSINDQEPFPVIIGVGKSNKTNKTHQFSLINSTVTGHTSSGLSEMVIKSSFAIIDHQIENFKDFKIGQVYLHTKFLEEWINVSGYKRNRLEEDNEVFSVNLEYKLPDAIPLYKNKELEIKVTFFASAPFYPLYKNVTISESAFLSIKFIRRQNFSYVQEIIDVINNFFTLVIGEPVPIDIIYMKIHSLEQQKRKKIESEPRFSLVRKQERRFTSRRSIHNRDMLLSLSEIQNKCPNFLGLWIENYSNYRPALNLYFGKIYSKAQYAENAFLDIVFSIEVFHRVLNPTFHGKGSKYLKMISSILGKLKKNEAEWLKTRLSKRNETTLLNRFEDIHENLKPITKKVFRNPMKAFEKIVTTRNYLVHYEVDPKRKQKVIPSDQLYKYTNKLTVVFQAYLIYCITMDMNLVVDSIRRPIANAIFIDYKE